ncbi:MAG: UbiA-like polyprenyltransferase [Candidatus Wallbacteria bacterium]
MLNKVKIIMELVKFEHTIFALPFAFAGALIAGHGSIAFTKILWILLAMVGARTAAMALNRVIDEKIDAENPRTKERALPKKIISKLAVWLLIFVSLAIFFLAAYNINISCFYLSPIAVLLLTFYSYTKRFTSLSHFYLGMTLAAAPVGGYMAVVPEFTLLQLTLAGCVMFWVAGFDIIYACQDIEFDKNNNLFSIPAVRGMAAALNISRILHFFTIAGFLFAGFLFAAEYPYYIAIAISACLLIYEHSLLKGGSLDKVDIAFFNVNGYVSIIIFAGILINYFV